MKAVVPATDKTAAEKCREDFSSSAPAAAPSSGGAASVSAAAPDDKHFRPAMPEKSSQEFVFGDLDGMLADDLAHSLVALAGDPIRNAIFQRLWLAEQRLRQERFEERLAFSAAVKEAEAESQALADVEAMGRAEAVAAVAADMTSQEPRPKRLATRPWPRPRPRPCPRPVPDEDDHFLDEHLRVAKNARTESLVAAPSAAATVAAIGRRRAPRAVGTER